MSSFRDAKSLIEAMQPFLRRRSEEGEEGQKRGRNTTAVKSPSMVQEEKDKEREQEEEQEEEEEEDAAMLTGRDPKILEGEVPRLQPQDAATLMNRLKSLEATSFNRER
jgi:hypothetical protein